MAEKRYLDEDGLSYFSQRLIAYINGPSSKAIKSVAVDVDKIFFFREETVPMIGTAIDTTKAVYQVEVQTQSAIDIIDNLTTDDATKVLSAKQGKILNDKIDALVVDNLTSTDTAKALSANQGKALNDKVDALVVDNLTTDDATKALSAKQGKELSDAVDALQSAQVQVVDNLTTEDGTKALSAKQGKILAEAKVDIVDNLTTDDSTKALSAKQGKYLYDNMPLMTISYVDIGVGTYMDTQNSLYVVVDPSATS